MRTDIVVQNVASFRIDPAVLTRPHQRLFLIASSSQYEKLAKRNRVDTFDGVRVLDEFSADTLRRAVEEVIADLPSDDRSSVRLVCHDEYSLGMVAEVRERLGIPGDRPNQLAPFVDKVTMKKALGAAGIALPAHAEWDPNGYAEDPGGYYARLTGLLGTDLFVKPVDESGSVGAQRLSDEAGFHSWARQVSNRRYEIDEFVVGELFHLDTVVRGGEIVHAEANAYLHPCHTYADGEVCGTYTLPDEHPARADLLDFNHDVLNALPDKPRDSVFHHEVYRRGDGSLVFLEIAARAPAALAPATSTIRWGLDIEEAHFRAQRGEAVHRNGPGPYAGFVYFPKVDGRIRELVRPDLTCDHTWTWNVEAGQTTQAPSDIRDFAASVLLWSDSFEVLRHNLDLLDRHQPLVTD
ncbi:acetyl-CoA carboxylase biotin carboxylase subunit family protein [Streptomyces sp. NBC_00199]|uniref:ATP-grasp domain-containing protein n=1 Tax=Streptomyces sp. NBC_00199 TaxID=2975678 RepID=UPI002254295F|nr:hypothetical protein [Streptomyces sp. NBC_00199]MCX5265956.1 hypothetical protein [Streptomyces sp. NBC_00199]